MHEPPTYFVESHHADFGWLRLKVGAMPLADAAATLELLLLQFSPHVDRWRLVNASSGEVAMSVSAELPAEETSCAER